MQKYVIEKSKLNIVINISENDYNRLVDNVDTKITNMILHDTYGNIIVDNKLSFDVVIREDFNSGKYRMNLEVYDITAYKMFGQLKFYENVSDLFPTSDMENGIDLFNGYEAFKKSIVETFEEFINYVKEV